MVHSYGFLLYSHFNLTIIVSIIFIQSFILTIRLEVDIFIHKLLILYIRPIKQNDEILFQQRQIHSNWLSFMYTEEYIQKSHKIVYEQVKDQYLNFLKRMLYFH